MPCRQTQPAEFWEDHRELLAGRDLQRRNGGTWLGVTKQGRFAFVTNYREVSWAQGAAVAADIRHVCLPAGAEGALAPQADFDGVKNASSRGDLPVQFLTSSLSPLEYVEAIDLQARAGAAVRCHLDSDLDTLQS